MYSLRAVHVNIITLVIAFFIFVKSYKHNIIIYYKNQFVLKYFEELVHCF